MLTLILTKPTKKKKKKTERERERERDLEEGGRDCNEKGGSSPEKSAKSNYMGTVMMHSQVSSKWVTRRLHNGSVQSE
jgi:hypothetical protein